MRLHTLTLNFSLALASAALTSGAHAALTIGSAGAVYQQNFDGLSNITPNTTNVAWANDSTLPGWSLFLKNTGAAPATYRADNGSSNTGYFYSYGSTGATDRALGSVGSSSATGYWGTVSSGTVAGWMAMALQNTSGKTLDGFSLSFDGEQWRDGGNSPAVAQGMTLEYGFGSSFGAVATWAAPGSSFNWSSPTFTTTAAALDGNAAANRVAGLGGTVSTNWATGQTLWVRWAEVNDNGSDHGLAIDNVKLTAGAEVPAPVPLPPAVALLAAGMSALGWVGRRRAGQA